MKREKVLNCIWPPKNFILFLLQFMTILLCAKYGEYIEKHMDGDMGGDVGRKICSFRELLMINGQ